MGTCRALQSNLTGVFWGHISKPYLDLPAPERERKVGLWDRPDIFREKCAISFSFPLAFVTNTILVLCPWNICKPHLPLVGTFEACLTGILRAQWHYLWIPDSWHRLVTGGCQFCKGSVIRCSSCSALERSFAGEEWALLSAVPSLFLLNLTSLSAQPRECQALNKPEGSCSLRMGH